MRKLADHIHSRGLKLGVYTDLTDRSCGHGPGSYGHYKIDAETFAKDWGADYLKVFIEPRRCVCRMHGEEGGDYLYLLLWRVMAFKTMLCL